MFENLIFSIAVSTHLGLSGDFASVHPHVQYQAPNDYIVGLYHNSDKRASVYAGKRATYKSLDIEYGYCAWI